jgi:hypothetical protein
MNKHNEVLSTLFSLKTIRARAQQALTLAKQDKLQHFALHLEQMPPTAAFVIDIIKQKYPSLDIPYHSRWRHFEVGGIDRVKHLLTQVGAVSAQEQGQILYELVIISVFLDAGSGPQWRYQEQNSGNEYTRSEGLAVASFDMYQKGLFSSDSSQPYRVDAAKLIALQEADLALGFQVSEQNPLAGLQGRVTLLNQLGKAIVNNKACFGFEGRLGGFYGHVHSLAQDYILSAESIFNAVLQGFNSIWPTRLSYEGVPLGDVWIHQGLKSELPASEYIPFHKLSQWLTYSLLEPLEQADIKVTDLDSLTGLPEYRNGGLFIDSSVLTAKNPQLLSQPQEPGSEAIVEWRALTVALLDELATLIRQQLHQDSHTLPLAKILQGGTWEAGRAIAKQKRDQGTPPIQIISDGTVF